MPVLPTLPSVVIIALFALYHSILWYEYARMYQMLATVERRFDTGTDLVIFHQVVFQTPY